MITALALELSIEGKNAEFIVQVFPVGLIGPRCRVTGLPPVSFSFRLWRFEFRIG